MEQVALKLRNVVKIFDAERSGAWPWPWSRRDGAASLLAVDHVSLDVRSGEIYGVLGANGSGKSTLIRVVSTLLIPDEGEVRVFGHDAVSDDMEVKRLLNRVSVEAAFFKKLSPMENLLYAARLYGLGIDKARGRIVELLQRLGIPERNIHEPLEKMSRGMQQKVSIARALLTSPRLLLLDEPTTGLDPRAKREVQDFVLQVRDQQGITVLLTTHDMDEAERLCDRIAILEQGRIVAEDSPDQLKRRVSGPSATTLEDVFLQLTGRDVIEEEVGSRR